MRELPAGTVTFLFTDIERSTRLLEELGEGYADVLAEHRTALREAFSRHGGVEVDTQGDAFFVAFARARDAIAAAIDARDALADGRVRVRMGVHTGEPLLTQHGYIGIDVHRAARIASAGHGGQILVSQAARDLLGADGLRDLGQHRLKDLTAAERIYQVGDEEFPPLKSLNRTNLPIAPAELVGRERELAELRDLLAGGARLVTITGAGGSGKTRLALQVAAEAAELFPDGVFFVPLAAVNDPTLVSSSIAQAAGVKSIDDLGQLSALLVIDNFEHLLASSAALGDVLGAAPKIRILATSRVRLNLSEEREFSLDPLLPDDAVAFFLERARVVRRDVRFEPSIADICRRLDGLPLALELAASRLKVLDPPLLLERLGRSLPVLTGGARNAPERQKTLRATIEWSFGLLEASLQDAFRKLSVFSGSFSLDAAESVANVSLDDIGDLVDWNLLQRTGDARFLMLETIREFSRELLEQSDDRDALCEGHLDAMVSLVTEAEPLLTGPDQKWWYERLTQDHDNIRAALGFACERGDGERALMLAGSIWRFWWNRGYTAEAAQWYERALALSSSASVRARARGELGAAHVAESIGKIDEMRERFERAAELLREAGETRWLILALTHLAGAYETLGDTARSESLNDEALRLASQIGDRRAIGVVKSNMASGSLEAGDDTRAAALISEALEELKGVGDTYGISRALADGALIALRRGDTHDAVSNLREALHLSHSIGDTQSLVAILSLVAAAVCARGDVVGGVVVAAGGETLRAAHRFDPSGPERKLADAAMQKARVELGADFDGVWQEGAQLDGDGVVDLARSKLET